MKTEDCEPISTSPIIIAVGAMKQLQFSYFWDVIPEMAKLAYK